MGELTHFDDRGASRMVDVGGKPVTERAAAASARVQMRPETLERIRAGGFAKGNVCEVARLAGIMAAKRTGELIPLCHPLGIDAAELNFEFEDNRTLRIEAKVQTTARTGVEMEAMVAVSIAALTVYDMCKSIDREMIVSSVQLEAKSGGKSGDFLRKPKADR